MSIGIAEAKPPFVMFETKVEEDRAASMEKGIFVGKDVDYAIITPACSKDRIVRQADEWLANLQDQVSQERFPADWLRYYKSMHKAWKEGQELPLEGTPIKTWAAVSPAMRESLLELRVRTVEELAIANEETMNRIGMGSRALKQQAVDWLAKADHGAEAVKALQAENETLKSQMLEMQKQLATLTAKPTGKL